MLLQEKNQSENVEFTMNIDVSFISLTWFSTSLIFLAIAVRSCSHPTRRVYNSRCVHFHKVIFEVEEINL